MKIPKIFIAGAGNVGSASAAAMVMRRLGRIVLYDAVADLAAGKAMDINHATPFFHSDSRVLGCNDTNELAGADVVVLAAGSPRRAGMSRADLLDENLSVLLGLGERVMADCPHAKVLVVTNPVDTLTGMLKRRWGEMNVFGLGCSLDTPRFRYFLAEEAGTSVDSVAGVVIGAHNDNMVPLVSQATIGGLRAADQLTAEQIGHVVRRTKNAGTAIVAKLRTRGSFYAASHTIAEIIEAVVRDTQAVFPLSIHCRGEYGYRDVPLALPCQVGITGVRKVLDVNLDSCERDALDACAEAMAGAMACSRKQA